MYSLKIFNDTLLTFEMKNDLGLEISDVNIVSNKLNLFPPLLSNEITPATIEGFLKTRVIPKNRWFVEEILTSSGLNKNDLKGIIDICKGLSLNDCYWIVDNENLKFEDFNLYDNQFSETLSLVAFTGYTSKIKGIITSPEYTTSGMLPKAWRRINEKVFLYKGSTELLGYANAGKEPYSEYYASEIAKTLGINSVAYDLTKWKGMVCSTCELFTSKKYSYVPMGYVFQTGGLKPISEYIEKMGLLNDFADMIMFDALIYNPDRHYGNFGFLRNNYTGEYEKLAPIFDNGAGLFSNCLDKDMKTISSLNEYIKKNNVENISYYGVDYKKLVSTFCRKEQVAKLKKMLTYTIEPHPKYNLEESRLKTLSNLVRQRANELIFEIEKDAKGDGA